MSFRRKIFVIIFAVALLPSLMVIALSAYLLNSTLNRIGASGLESSLISAKILVDESQSVAGELLKSKMLSTNFGHDNKDLEQWLKANQVDMAFVIQNGSLKWASSDSIQIDPNILQATLPLAEGLSHIENGGLFFLAYSLGDSSLLTGCAILMPVDYGINGHRLANSMSASASLGMFKTFSLKLLGALSLIVIVISLLIAFAFSTIISGYLVKPLERLRRGAAVIGAGNLDHQVEIESRDEFSSLAASFNQMAADIKANQNKLLEAQRLAAWREVARRIAHEIKNPLTPINIELYRLQERLNRTPNQENTESNNSLEAIRHQIQTLQNMALQFSTFAKEPELRLSISSLKDVITQSARLFDSYANACINLDLPDNLPLVKIDSQMMGRVFGNLIKNAIEAAAQAKIDIQARALDNNIKIIFRDNGPGFPPEKLEKIDQPYLTTKKTGTGMGLVIVQKIIQEHGGKIRFYNDNGAVVEIELPI